MELMFSVELLEFRHASAENIRGSSNDWHGSLQVKSIPWCREVQVRFIWLGLYGSCQYMESESRDEEKEAVNPGHLEQQRAIKEVELVEGKRAATVRTSPR